MTVATADDLRANLIGAWTLQSYVSMSIDGSDVVCPLGVDARGIIMYTPDGYKSAQLMRRDKGEADGYFNYAGPFTVVGVDACHEGHQEAHCAERSRRGDT